MKKILIVVACLFSMAAHAITYTPISTLNPTGSTSGYVITSTGPTSAPVWAASSGGGGTLAISGGGTGQTTQAAALTALLGSSTVPVANGGTGSTTASAARTALGLGTAATVATGTSGATIPLLSTANTWTLAQAFTVRPTFNGNTPYDTGNLTIASYGLLANPLSQFASTTSAQLATVLSDETGSGVVVYNISPAITTPVVAGVTSGAATATGKVGEHLTATAATVSITSGTTINVVTLSLTAGVYEVNAVVLFTPAGTTVMQGEYGGVSTTSATLGAFQYFQYTNNNQAAGQGIQLPTPMVYVNTSSSVTAYCVASAAFTTSTATVSCKIDALRVQ